jgi:hypothetical protein
VGAFAAAVIAGVLPLREGLELVKLRARNGEALSERLWFICDRRTD